MKTAILLIAVFLFLQPPPDPEEDVWVPDPDDVAYISRTIYGETRGCCQQEQECVAWCILARVSDPRFPDTVKEVVLQPLQWQGYSSSNPASPFWDMAESILIQWHNGTWGMPQSMCWCSGDGTHQTFRDSWIVTADTQFWPER